MIAYRNITLLRYYVKFLILRPSINLLSAAFFNEKTQRRSKAERKVYRSMSPWGYRFQTHRPIDL
jgi:hypothetical protein